MESVQNFYANLGLDTPLMRGAATAAVAYGAITLMQPAWAYSEVGHPRPFKLLDMQNNEASYFAPIPAALMAGVAAYLLV